ncbi:MAG: heavy metal sensor histidine kinase [Planctomycetaceae bacterium]|nr:heavy metal sensor histidine kinase [Planctomycetaceae bacterium]
MNRLSIRWRMSLWYSAVLAGILAIFGMSVYLLMQRGLQNRTNKSLAVQMAVLEDQLTRLRQSSEIREWLQRQYVRHPGVEVQVTAADGSILLRGSPMGNAGLPPKASTDGKRDIFDNFSVAELGRFRMLSRRIKGPDGPLLVQVACSLEENDKQLGELLAILLLVGLPAVACSLGGSYVLARQALAPVERMAATADEITARRLDRRLDAPNPNDELGRLAKTLNGMIGRLERSFEEVRRFTADAAHELRTPLAILRNEAEVALRVPRDSEQYRDCLEDMLEEIDHLSRLSDALLFLFREDAGLGALARDPVDLQEIVRQITDHMRVVAAEKHQELSVDAPSPCWAMGNAEQLRRLLFNLLENAIKFTPDGGRIDVRVESRKEQACIAVCDSGAGIAPEHLPRIFDRFYRVDSARSRRTGGNGLGLSISKSIVEAHHGTIEVKSQPDAGTQVTVTLPAMTSPPPRAPKPEALSTHEV